MKTRAPKNQTERLTNDGVTKFKSDKPNKRYFSDSAEGRVTHEDFKRVSRGKATEK